ncbi:Extracellular ligand-binding receptor [Emticicia oligotrophica DSM 17448]|uniref:Extracellular ligand-binding receptor n=1 Tax=Emticicia oligotrophica (strain DSM 17448 / CIP 109782 / MTCC 6937 / GPTSA100-15) TaxID=929562 RepID=A0ABM5MXL4_EMTOG|nr:ABC transporter substrate-binding protein [Emticicia oligotrophica]AFK01870.1 Extracellular ligand-binding receptor [Emticicia oligotrophica DSM 17448]
MKRCYCLFIFLLLSKALLAQQATLSEREYALKYKKAVQLYASQQYIEAQNELTPLTHRKYNNAMVPYAHFYHALCSFKQNKFFESRVYLRQLFERYPDWDKIDEAYYLYANASFSDNNIDEGMQYVNRITAPIFKKDLDNMLYYHFSKVSDRTQLKLLNQKFPNNPIIAQLLVDNIQKSKNVNKEDLELSDRLTNRFSLGENANSAKKNAAKRENKGVVNVAILLPFRLNDFDPAKANRTNQYIYDLYAGMKLAKSKLESEQINVNLLTFDIDRDANSISSIVDESQFSQVDLLIGPLYPEANKIANNYAKSNDVIQVHPLSNNQQLITNEKNTFLASPSFETQAAKALEYVKNQSIGRTVAIYFGNTRKDSTFAYAYRDKAISAGIEVITIKKFLNAEDIDTRRRPSHVFVSGSEETFGGKIISALDKKKINSPIIATSSAFDFEGASLNIFNRDLYLIKLDYVNRDKEEVKNFRSIYFNEQNIAPSFYSYWGYDILLFYGRMLHTGKNYLRTHLNAIEYTQGYTLDGFDYTNGSNENQIVPIIKYQDGKFVEVMR